MLSLRPTRSSTAQVTTQVSAVTSRLTAPSVDNNNDDDASVWPAPCWTRLGNMTDPPGPPGSEDNCSDVVMVSDPALTPLSCEEKPLPGQTKPVKHKRVWFGNPGETLVHTRTYSAAPLKDAFAAPSIELLSRHGRIAATPIAPTHSRSWRADTCRLRTSLVQGEEATRRCVSPSDLQVTDGSTEPVTTSPDSPELPQHLVATTTHTAETCIAETFGADWENPFRPDGELSRAADAIVRAIRTGRSLDRSVMESPVQPRRHAASQHSAVVHDVAPTDRQSPADRNDVPDGGPSSADFSSHSVEDDLAVCNGNGAATAHQLLVVQQPGQLQVRHHLVELAASQPEHVTLGSSSRGECCVMQ